MDIEYINEDANWIQVDNKPSEDTYSEYYTEFNYIGGKTYLDISVDSNYVVFVNGSFVNSGQFPDFPHYKIYDKLDITNYCIHGKNKLGIITWYYGIETMSYYKSTAALKFAVYIEDMLICKSDEKTLSRYSLTYKNGEMKKINHLLGLSYSYDATQEDNWLSGDLKGFSASTLADCNTPVYKRQIDKCIISDIAPSKLIKTDKNYYLFDLGREEVGYLSIKVKSNQKQTLTIYYGEHIDDGKVRGIINSSNYSVQVTIGEGVTEYANYFLRMGLRYLEIHSQTDLEIDYASVRPCKYPLCKNKRTFKNDLHQRIYDVSVRTLELCMHDHYEDCPWREQALYVMDSRNQMFCGFYAFSEYRFPRENLNLISKDNRSDNLLAICTPTAADLTIPSFSLHYFTAVYEYSLYSNDLTLAKDVLPKLESIMSVFEGRIENGLVASFEEANHWNYYEWTDGLSGALNSAVDKAYEAALNCMVSLAMQNLHKIYEMLEIKSDYMAKADALNVKIKEAFFNQADGLFINADNSPAYSELVNSLAILCGAANGNEAKRICETLASDSTLTKTSLSMACFKYDALLITDKKAYRDYIIKDIEEKYSRMLDAGATSFWETEKGSSDFHNSGSLCHGWSAMPVYYLTTLLD